MGKHDVLAIVTEEEWFGDEEYTFSQFYCRSSEYSDNTGVSVS